MADRTEFRHDALTPTQVLARTLKTLYPSNPDVVLGRAARLIVEAFTEAGMAVVERGCAHRFDPVCGRCRTLRKYQPWLSDGDSGGPSNG